MRIGLVLAAGLCGALLAGAAHGQAGGPTGVAFSQAPEAGAGVCFGDVMSETMSCARDKCVAESGLTAVDCAPMLWRQPAGWCADVFLQHREGPHWHEMLCGWADEAQLQAAIDVKCSSQFLIECSAVQMWDPSGAPLEPGDAGDVASDAVSDGPWAGQSWGGKVRSGPGMEYPQVGSLTEGEAITLVRNAGAEMNGYDWFEIRYRGGQAGYQWGGILCAADGALPGTFGSPCP